MSNISTGCFGIFKKNANRASNHQDGNVRRSRSSIGGDPLWYLRPSPTEKEQEKEAKERDDRMDGTKIHNRERSGPMPKQQTLAEQKKEEQTDLEIKPEREVPEKIRKRERERQIANIRKREMEREREREREREKGLETEAGIGAGSRKILTKSTTKTKTPKTTAVVAGPEDDFSRNIVILEEQIDNLDLRCKMMATMWLSRLRTPTQNEEEIRARNIITAHLIKCRNENIFQKVPFNLPPTSETLANIRQKMCLTRDTLCHDLTLANRMETKAYLNKLFHDSYDGGKFLGKLPVPRDGAFFILHLRPNL